MLACLNGSMKPSADVVDEDPGWRNLSEEMRARVAPAHFGAQVNHFGSSAVPGPPSPGWSYRYL